MKEEKREIIRNAATQLFAEKGFENTTTRDIAKAANISNASLYYYFDSKEELLYQILDKEMSSGLELITEIDKSDIGLKEKLSKVLQIHTSSAVDYNKMKLLVIDQNSISQKNKEDLKEKQRDYVEKLIKILDELKDNGEIVDIDTTVLAFAFFGMVSWAYRWYNPKGNIKPAELSEIFHQIFTKGIYSEVSS
ncbi:MAG: TetR/AcrR family transcriptional regulator [Deltaproteobacteria bacterium]|nr:TetR/AcrR family transcriptional regulator [Deltaproteobacteria bacterium]